MGHWILEDTSTLIIVFLSVLALFTIIIIITRISGLRTFAKMSSFDFASTIALGSILASVVLNPDQSIIKGAVALGAIIAFQTAFAYIKRKSKALSNMMTNTPMLLMDGNTILYGNLAKTNMSETDLLAKLREANVRNFDEILVVVLESTGDVSVIHAGNEIKFDRERLLNGVNLG